MKISLIVWIICMFTVGIVPTYFITMRLNAEHEEELVALTAQLRVCEDNYSDSEELVEHLKLVQKLMDDGATLKQAEQIIEVSEEAGISVKL